MCLHSEWHALVRPAAPAVALGVQQPFVGRRAGGDKGAGKAAHIADAKKLRRRTDLQWVAACAQSEAKLWMEQEVVGRIVMRVQGAQRQQHALRSDAGEGGMSGTLPC